MQQLRPQLQPIRSSRPSQLPTALLLPAAAATRAGSGGEFLVACRPRGTVRLSIPVSADSTIELPLPSRKEIRCHEKIH